MIPLTDTTQENLFSGELKSLCNPRHPLIQLAHQMEWGELEAAFAGCYCPDFGRPCKPIRLLVGIHYLKHAYHLSDEEVVERLAENPYWQYFCGFEYFQRELFLNASLLSKWRKRIQQQKMEKLLEVTITTGLKTGALKRRQLAKLNVDTTVQEKAITYPTDAKLYLKMLQRLVNLCHQEGIELRQSYTRKAKKSLFLYHRYAHGRKGKKAQKEWKKLKVYLGRVSRDVGRKVLKANREELWEVLGPELAMAQRLLEQKREDSPKLYSLHAPEVECIAKGKAHKKYEFGCKVSVVATSQDPFIVGMQALHGNPYDGHTLEQALKQAERLGHFQAQEVYADQGYRGHDYAGEATIHLSRWKLSGLKESVIRWIKRRSAIEPVIGHAKTDGWLGRNYLKGTHGDHINAILCGCGYNIRKLLRKLLFVLWKIRLGRFLSLSQSSLFVSYNLKKKLFQGHLSKSSVTLETNAFNALS